MATNASVVHEVVQALRAGTIGAHAFSRIVLVGHSLGSFVSWLEAGTYHDVDGVIISGLLHLVNATGAAAFIATLYPALLDPRFAAKALHGNYIGYVTTEPGTRGRSFYYLPNADPHVIATDEATKETITPGEVASFPVPLVEDISAQIQVPVLVVVGQQDALFCGAAVEDCRSSDSLQHTEAAFYAPQAHLQVAVIPNAGHDLNLHKKRVPLVYGRDPMGCCTCGSLMGVAGQLWERSSSSHRGWVMPVPADIPAWPGSCWQHWPGEQRPAA